MSPSGQARADLQRLAGVGAARERSDMKQYLLSIYQPDGPVPTPDILGKIKQDLEVLNREMKAAGAWVFTAGLHPPSTATVVKAQAGELLITDGPFTETKEHIGGFTIIRHPTWTRRSSGVRSSRGPPLFPSR